MIARLTRRKGASLILMLMIYALAFPMNVLAMPQGGHVVAGEANISLADPQTMNIHQGTPSAILNWQQFSIGQPEAVHFMQPSAAAVSLNRVVGVDPSAIHGLLSANGRVFLINPNGVLVGPTGRIETGGFVASTLDMANQDFLNGNYTFVQDPAQPLGAILNQGLIQASQGGNVSLIAPAVENQGTILANLGTVSLGAGEQVTLAFAGNDMIRFAVDEPVTGQVIGPDGTPLEHSLLNSGKISANGGEVILSARSAFDAVKSVVNNTGVIEAKTIADNNGIIRLEGGEQGIVFNSGTLDVSGTDPGETAGEVRVTGEKVGLVHYSEILAKGRQGGGKVLVGGDFQGKNPDVPNAKRTYVGSDSVINADAIESGDGGRVIVWSDEVTRFYGDVSARGGVEGGDGGFTEVSGKSHLDYTGIVDLTAFVGKAGTLLLDPNELNITASTGTDNGLLNAPGDAIFAFGEGSEPSNITAVHLVGQLNLADITLQANNQIDVETAVDASGQTGNGGNSFGLELDSPTINFSNNANIILNNATLTIGNSTAGNVVLAQGATVTLDTGAGEGNIEIAGTVNGTTGGVAETLTLDAGTSNPLTGALTSSGTLTVGSLDLDGTDFNINQGFASAGIVDIGNSGVLTLAGAASTAGGAVSVSGDANLAVGITTTDDLIDLNGNVVLAEGATITLGTGAGEGNIEIAGTVNGTTGGAAEGLTLDAGTGNITLSGQVGNGAADELTTLTIADAEVV